MNREEVFNLNKTNFNNQANDINRIQTLRAGDDRMFNKKNISTDIVSSSSASSSGGSVSSLSETSSESSTGSSTNKKKFNNKKNINNKNNDSDGNSSSTQSISSVGSDSNTTTSLSISKRKRSNNVEKDSIREKKEIIYQLDRLESRGYKIPFKFNLNSNLEEMKLEYNKLLKEKEIDNSIRFQRKMLMAFVTGSEYLNTRYDPFAIQLDGWSEQVHDSINDYDDIFEELHDKYKSAGKKMAPELRLFISLSGSAFMFHLTNRMFKEQPLPDVENVLKSNPELMKQFQQAAAKEYILPNNNNNLRNKQNNTQNNMQNSAGILGMVSGLFNNLGGGSMRNNIKEDDDDSISEIESIIDNVHKNISINNTNSNNIETLSVSDEEITSIIEDNADVKILQSKKNNRRTLNI